MGLGYLSCRADSSIVTTDTTKREPEQEVDTRTGSRHRLHHFTHRQLEAATSNFADETLLGRGSHGSVYKARLPSGRIVAVKRPSRVRHRHTPIRLVSSLTLTTTRNEVENEVQVLSQIHNPRLVNLIGFTPDSNKNPTSSSSKSSSYTYQNEQLLVLEYMPNGTLYDLLHTNPRPPGWARRLRLALQTAKAVLCLHSHHPAVVHRDVKSANVLLDHAGNARLCDFGLAVFDSSTSMPPAGTLGYLDPAYVTPENLSTKTDVFSFGILLLEIMSGRKAIDVAHSPPSIVEWAVPMMRKGKVLGLYDTRIAPPRDPVARRQLAVLAASCVRSCRDKRPSMGEVVEKLKVLSKTVAFKGWGGLTVGNPCSAIETAGTLQKVSHGSSVRSTKSSPRRSLDEGDVVVGSGVGGARNARRVFSEWSYVDAKVSDKEGGGLGVGVHRKKDRGVDRARARRTRSVGGDKSNVQRIGFDALLLSEKNAESNGRRSPL